MILSSVVASVMANWIVLIPMLLIVLFWVLVIICIVRISIYFRNAGKEQKLIRMELGKLAEEVKQVRQALKHEEGGAS